MTPASAPRPTDAEITSVANPAVQAARRLHRRRHRAATGQLLVEGPHAVAEALTVLATVFVGRTRSDAATAVAERCREAGADVVAVSDAVLGALADTEQPQGIVGVARRPPSHLDALLADAKLLVILDRVADPGNLGTIVRTADAAGADGVVVTAGSVDPTNAKAVRASAGSLFHLPVVDGVAADDLARRCRAAGIAVIVADPTAPDAHDRVSYPARSAIVCGSEAHGLSETWRRAADAAVAVPISRRRRPGHSGHAESLNLATTTAIILYEVTRQWAGRTDR